MNLYRLLMISNNLLKSFYLFRDREWVDDEYPCEGPWPGQQTRPGLRTPGREEQENEAEEFEPPPFQSNQERGGNVLGRVAGLNLPERFHVIYVNIFLD